ncbi:MAG: arginyltransferase [Rhodospirillales bacterium]|nr:arginyltransferase [Rhodospirillales bacterium]
MRPDRGGEGQASLQAFHVLPETPCPYLPHRNERKLFTDLATPGGRHLYDRLSRAGFRRSHRFAYRPACTGCQACVPVRIDARSFRVGSSLRRVRRRNADLWSQQRPARATSEHYRLFARYVEARHGDSDMATMTFADYRAMVEESVLDTRLHELRDAKGTLMAVALVDWLEDGPSAVYSFFEAGTRGPGAQNSGARSRSLGSQIILQLIDETLACGLPYVYLGYWIAETRKMAYKTRFRPLEALGTKGWYVLEPAKPRLR